MKRVTFSFINASSSTTVAAKSIEERVRKAAGIDASAEVVCTTATTTFGECIAKWEAAKGDFRAVIEDKIDTYDTFDCLVVVADSTNVVSSCADVSYALYAKQIPVVVFALSDAGSTYAANHPLLTAVSVSAENINASIASYFSFPSQRGRVIVVEGGDGAGKQTQVALLCQRLERDGFPVATLDYPHDAARYGVLIRELLSGKLGSIRDVDPLMFASLYGLNREDTLPRLRYWIQRGKNVVLDRYFTANFGHQASKLASEEERNAVIEKLKKFELGWLRLPDANKVLYLNLPPDFAFKAMQQDGTRQELDMHEKAGIEYKDNVRKAFLWCCESQAGWQEVSCVDPEGTTRYSREDVHNTIFSAVQSILVNKAA